MAKAIYELPVTRDDVVVLQLALETFSNKCHYLVNEDEDINANTEHEEGEE